MLDLLKNLQIILSVICLVCAHDEYKIVETTNGQVRGICKKTLLENKDYVAFKGIPYAKPPINDLRFKAPEPIESWTPNILDAFEHGPNCIQTIEIFPNPYQQSEDCLTLNVYVPGDLNSNEKFAVLFYIHGGGYAEGSGNDILYGPDFIMEKQTILVTINYRVGVLGFLSLNTPEYSGSMGLKDQQLALKWFHANVERFGGDIKRITVFGHSAGGASAHIQAVSAESRRYFNNAIVWSGSALNSFAVTNRDKNIALSQEIANDFNVPSNSEKDLIEFFKSVPAERIVNYGSLFDNKKKHAILLAPIIEQNDAVRPFLLESILETYKTSDIPVDMMFSITTLEGFFSISKKFGREYNYKLVDQYFGFVFPFVGLNISMNSADYPELTKEVREFYFRDGIIDEKTSDEFAQFVTDVFMAYGVDVSVQSHSKIPNVKTFYFQFSVESLLNMWKITEDSSILGATHCDDICYLFRCGMMQSQYDKIIHFKFCPFDPKSVD